MSIQYPEFNYQIEEWDEREAHCTTLALTVDMNTALAAFESIVEHRPNRIIYLRNGARLVHRHGPPRPDAVIIPIR